MDINKIKSILENNDESKVRYYLDILINKQSGLSREGDRLGLYIIVIIFLFYLIDNSIAKSLNVGPISIDDLLAIKVFIPLVMSFLILRYQVISAQNAALKNISKLITSTYFGANNLDLGNGQTDDFTRSLLPLSIYEEIGRIILARNGFLGCLVGVFILPFMIAIGLAPFYFEWIWLETQFSQFSDLNFYEKTASVITVWILIVGIYYLFQTILTASKQGVDTGSQQ